jgi:hypothetical protein
MLNKEYDNMFFFFKKKKNKIHNYLCKSNPLNPSLEN